MQKRSKIVSSVMFFAIAVVPLAMGQEAVSKMARVLGEVTAADGSSLTIKTDAGTSSTVLLDEKTNYLRVPPGEQDLKKAAKIELKDVSVGDRVLARSRIGEDQKPGPATSVIVMSKSDIAKKQEAEKLEWQKRGVSGTVTSINTDAKEITISARSRGASKPMVIESSDKVQYRRYAPDSIRFSDAHPSVFADLKVGDQVRVLGEKNADETRIKPEMIVSGTFHNVAGTVKEVNAAAGEIKITNLETKKLLTVQVNADSNLKRVPPTMAGFLARMAGGGAGAGGGAPAAGGPGGAGGDRPRMGAGGGPGAGGPGAGGPGGGGMGPRGGGDFSQMLERMPAFNISELKPGDAVIVASTAGSDPARVTAITLLAGVEPLLTRPAGDNRPVGGAWNFDINIVP
jgi:transcription antitermination factor NusG